MKMSTRIFFDQELIHRLKNHDFEWIRKELSGSYRSISTASIEEALNTENPSLIQLVFDNVNPQSFNDFQVFEYLAKIQSVPALQGVLRSLVFQNPTSNLSRIYHPFIRYVFDTVTLWKIIDLLLVNEYPVPSIRDIYYIYLKDWDEILDRILMDPRVDIRGLDSYLDQEIDNYPLGLIVLRQDRLKNQQSKVN